jgi:hypothetical protein
VAGVVEGNQLDEEAFSAVWPLGQRRVYGIEAVRSFWDQSRDVYFWKARRESGCPRWFEGRSHLALSCPQATPEAIAVIVIATRQRFKFFGLKKIRGWLIAHHPNTAWPAASPMGYILKRAIV